MKYEVRCECGKPFAVTGEDAGTSLRCGCNRTVEVPPLHKLRSNAGQDALPAEMTLANMLANRQLPDTAECAICREPTQRIVRAAVVCEQAEEKTNVVDRAGCFLLGLLMHCIVILRPESRVVGRNVQYLVPVRCCDLCASRLTNADLRLALRRNPVCAAVLDKYPHAHIDRAG